MGMLTKDRTIKEAKQFFKLARKQVGEKNPATIVTDGCGAYERGISSNFWKKIRMGTQIRSKTRIKGSNSALCRTTH